MVVAPDVIAVRGAVCRGGRGGNIEASLVAEFRSELARNSLAALHSGVAASGKKFLLDNGAARPILHPSAETVHRNVGLVEDSASN
jgi:hypothetical protein